MVETREQANSESQSKGLGESLFLHMSNPSSMIPNTINSAKAIYEHRAISPEASLHMVQNSFKKEKK